MTITITEKQLHQMQVTGRKFKTKYRPSLNQWYVVDGNAYFTNTHIMIKVKDTDLSKSIPVEKTNYCDGCDGFYPSNLDGLIEGVAKETLVQVITFNIIKTMKFMRDNKPLFKASQMLCRFELENGEYVIKDGATGIFKAFHFDYNYFYNLLSFFKGFGFKEVNFHLVKSDKRGYVRPSKMEAGNIEALISPIRAGDVEKV